MAHGSILFASRFLLRIFLSVLFLFSTSLSLASDIIAPKIVHERVVYDIEVGEKHLVTARVTDNTGVESVTLYFRLIGETEYQQRPMYNSLDQSDHYETMLYSDEIQSPGFQYYIQARDSSGNTLEMHGTNGRPFEIAVVQQNVEIVNNINIDGNDGSYAGSLDPNNPVKSKKKKGKSWLWVGLGVLALGALAAAGGGGGGDTGTTPPVSKPQVGDLDISIDTP